MSKRCPKTLYKRHALIFLKYSPAVMAVICSIKLFFYYLEEFAIVHYINAILNLYIVYGIYLLGKTFGYCWKHRSLCRTAMWGYIIYTIAFALNIDNEYLLLPAALYIILVLIMTSLYKSI